MKLSPHRAKAGVFKLAGHQIAHHFRWHDPGCPILPRYARQGTLVLRGRWQRAMPPSPAPVPMTRAAAAAADLAVGIAAGLAAALAMNLFQSAWAKVASPPSEGPTATEEVADALSEAVSGKRATKRARRTLANIVHYATGALFGGVYGLVGGIVPGLTAGRGALFAGTTWMLGDEIAVPRLGLGPKPQETEAQAHAFGLASHLVFGLTLDFARRRLNGLISARP